MEVATPLSGLARALVQNDLLLLHDVEAIQKQANNEGSGFIEQLVQSKKMTAREVALFASKIFGYPFFDLSVYDQDCFPKDVVDNEIVSKNRLLPIFKRGNRLFLATSDPTQSSVFHAITFETGLTLDLIVVEDDKLGKLIDTYEQSGTDAIQELVAEELNEGDFDSKDEDDGIAVGVDEEDAPIVKFIHKVLIDAVNIGASDIHFEPYEKFYRIRYRIDGQLREIVQPPLPLKEKIASRLKVISRLDISEKRVPQDGRLKLKVTNTRAIDFRVNTLPTLFGEKIVMRILDSSAASLNIEQLGFESIQKELLLEAIHRPYGMVLVTGPTGSGKTVSLYTCLNLLNDPAKNISTAEDPVEINLAGINQVNVSDKVGLTFAAALKSFLRQDPDIIMVGEIRDFGTADIAIKAAQTGHMVFSTLHTNNAPATLSRLLNMGVAPFNIASSVLLIMAQRLVRRLCSNCKAPVNIPEEALFAAGFTEDDLTGEWKPYGPVGCDECRGRGYKGRAGVYEIMPISEEMTRIIMKNGTAVDISDQALKDGMIDLRRAGLLKVIQGITSLEEVEAVTNE